MNTQPREQPVQHSKLEVHSFFYTLQGEAVYAGWPAVFVRMAGCSLQCPQCDTDYTSTRTRYGPHELVGEILLIGDKATLIVITGGEPFRQNIHQFVTALKAEGFVIQVETNGLAHPGPLALEYIDTVVISPKTEKINACWATCDQVAYKYIVKAGAVDPYDGLPTSALGMPGRPARPFITAKSDIYLQPEWSADAAQYDANVQECIASCMRHGYRLSLQTHKLAGLP